jgi:AcrR family transcriptional regulator
VPEVSSRPPPYARIAAELADRIAAGELRPGDRVPSTREITRTWGVAMATATRALASLRDRGLVHAEPGRGTVVTHPAPTRAATAPTPRTGTGPARTGPTATRTGTTATRAATAPARPSGTGSDHALTRERIVRAAIELADQEGLGALSMRRIATELGLATMSIYRYLPGKDALLTQMSDAVYRDHPLPEPPPADWRAGLELAGRTEWAIFRGHPWLARVISLTRPQPMPHGMRHTEWILRAVDGLGLAPRTMLHIVLTLHGFVAGIAVNVETERDAAQDTGISQEQWLTQQDATFTEILRQHPLPVLTRVTADPTVDVELDGLFEFGLARLLDGFATLITPAQAP